MAVEAGSIGSTVSCASFNSITLVALLTGTWLRPFLLMMHEYSTLFNLFRVFLKKVCDDGDQVLNFLIIIQNRLNNEILPFLLSREQNNLLVSQQSSLKKW